MECVLEMVLEGGGTVLGRGWGRTVSPFRARSKRRAARSRAAGGRADGEGEAGDWTAPSVSGGCGLDRGCVAVVVAVVAADWPYASAKEGIVKVTGLQDPWCSLR